MQTFPFALLPAAIFKERREPLNMKRLSKRMPSKGCLWACASFCAFCLLASQVTGQLAPAGTVYIESPSGVHYIFGSGGTTTGAGLIYINYLTQEYDIISAIPVSSNGSFSGTSTLTGRSISGQISATTISLTYAGSTLSGPKLSAYGSSSAFAGYYVGSVYEPSLGISYANIINLTNGKVVVVNITNDGTIIGVGSISSSGAVLLTTIYGETVSTTFSPPVNGIVQGTAFSSLGYLYTYSGIKATPARLANISTRGFIGGGEQVLIGGFIVKDGGKTVLINAKGPSLAAFGVAAPLLNPRLDLYQGSQLISSNANWRTNSNAAEITASGVGPSDDREASLQVALEPGAYTVIVSSEDGSQGIGLVEAFSIN